VGVVPSTVEPSAVADHLIAVTGPGSPIGRLLVELLGRPGFRADGLLVWRL
jgi:hypothetical protein